MLDTDFKLVLFSKGFTPRFNIVISNVNRPI